MQAMSRAKPTQQQPGRAAPPDVAAAKAEAGQAGQEAEPELPPARPSILAGGSHLGRAAEEGWDEGTPLPLSGCTADSAASL